MSVLDELNGHKKAMQLVEKKLLHVLDLTSHMANFTREKGCVGGRIEPFFKGAQDGYEFGERQLNSLLEWIKGVNDGLDDATATELEHMEIAAGKHGSY